jgi:hypothetical protein
MSYIWQFVGYTREFSFGLIPHFKHPNGPTNVECFKCYSGKNLAKKTLYTIIVELVTCNIFNKLRLRINVYKVFYTFLYVPFMFTLCFSIITSTSHLFVTFILCYVIAQPKLEGRQVRNGGPR